MIVSISLGSPTLSPAVLRVSAVDERISDGTLDDDPPRRHADLSLMEEGAECGCIDRVVEVRVGEHDERVLAAELEHDALEVAPRRLGEAPSRRGRPGEVEAPDLGVLDELIADRGCLTGRMGDDVEHARGQPASAKISPQTRPPLYGDSSDGLSTTVLPNTSGAVMERAERMSAAFHGAIAPTTPTGRRTAIATAPGMSDGMIWPIGA